MTYVGVVANTAYEIATQKGIPLIGETFDELKKMIRPEEILVVLYLSGSTFNIERAKKISNEQDLVAYRENEHWKHVGFFAVKKIHLLGVKDLH